MKSLSSKTIPAATAAAITLLVPGLAPATTAVRAETVLILDLADKAPPAATGTSAGTAAAIGIIGGIIAGAAIANAVRPTEGRAQPVGDANAHAGWSHAGHESYRERDNSYQPNHGAPRPCISP